MRRDISKAGIKERAVRIGGYETLLGVIFILMALAINLFASAIPIRYSRFDTSSQKLYTISPQTIEVLAQLDRDVTLYYIAIQGRYDFAIHDMVKRYDSLSDRVRLEYVDPLLYPNFATQYTSESLVGNDIIVKIGDKTRLVSYADIYDIIFTTSYTSANITYDTIFQGESALTNAISYMIKGNMPSVYSITGHGEVPVPPDLARFIERQNIELKELSLLSSDIPADAECLILMSPRTDLSDRELEMILHYLSTGGDMVMLTDYIDRELPNVEKLANSFGLEKINGLVLEPSSGFRMSGYPMNLVPEMHVHDVTIPLVRNRYIAMLPGCHGIGILSAYRDTLSITPLMTTSPYAYLKADAISQEVLNLSKEDTDISGSFIVGAAVTERLSTGESRLIWISTSEFIKENYDSVSSGANRDLFVNAIAWMCDLEDAVSIHAKTISTKYLSLSGSQSRSLAILFIGVFPLIFIAAGGFVWRRRVRS